MNIHEYQAKALLRDYGAPVADGYVATTPQEAVAAAGKLKPGAWVVKAQIHAGGRGKGGGIKLVKTLEELRGQAERMLGKPLVTPQTGPKGRPVAQVYVVEDIAIGRELYLSLLVDRDSGRVAFIASTEGGVNIEEVAVKTPEKITTLTVDPASGLAPFHTRIIASALKLEGDQAKQCAKLVERALPAVPRQGCEPDRDQPSGGDQGRQAHLPRCQDRLRRQRGVPPSRHRSLARFRSGGTGRGRGSRLGLSYVKLDGTIGCMVNGAGLAMATMDIIKLRGGEPANFLDVGGGASKEKIAEAFKIILSDPHVKGVLVNIFGGIMRCDVIAEGIIEAVREVKIGVPLVVRLEGTNVARGKTLAAGVGAFRHSSRRSRRRRTENRRCSQGRGVRRVRQNGPSRIAQRRGMLGASWWGRIDDGRGRRVDQSLPAMRQRGVSRAAPAIPPRLGRSWNVASCTFVYLRNPPEYKHLVSDFAWEKTRVAEVERRKARSPIRMWLDSVTRWRAGIYSPGIAGTLKRLFTPGRVLDVGCGSGKKVPEPFVPFGVEISEALSREADDHMRARGGRAIHAPAVDGVKEFPDRYFSGILLRSFLEHEKQPKELLEQCSRVLAPGGSIYVRVPNYGSLNRRMLGAKWCGFRYPDQSTTSRRRRSAPWPAIAD